MADNSVDIVVSLDDKQAQAELNRLTKKIDSLRAQLKAAEDARLPLVEQAQQLGVQLDNAKAKLEEMLNAQQGTYSADQIANQKETIKSLQAQWDAVNKKIEGYDRKIERATVSLQENEARAGELSAQLVGVGEQAQGAAEEGVEAADKGAKAADSVSSSLNGISLGLDKVMRRIAGLVKRVFFFSLITKALRSLRQYVSSAMQSSNEFSVAVGRLKGALATAFQPILEAAVPALTTLINALTRVISLVASVISMLFGTTIEKSAAAAKKLNEESKAISGVGNAAKKASTQLAGFDEINRLESNDESSLRFDFPMSDELPAFKKIKELFDSLDFSKLKKSWDKLKKSVKGLADTIKNGLGWAWDNILVPLAKWTIEEAAPAVVDALAAAFDLLKAALEKFGEIFKPLWEKFLKPFFEMLGNIALGGIKALSGFLGDLAEAISNFELSADGFGKFVEDVFGAAGTAIGNFGTNAAKAIGDFIDELDKHTDLDLTEIKRKVMLEINYLALKIEAFCMKAGWVIGDLVKLIGHLVSGDMEAVKKDFAQLVNDASVELDDECVEMAKSLTETATDGEEASENLGRAFKDICNDARNELPAAEDAAKSFNNSLLDVLATIQKLLGISVNGGLIGLLSGQGWHLSMSDGLTVPHLAEGSVIPPNREFLAVLGDQKSGTNIEAPLDTIVQAFRMAMASDNDRPLEVKVYLDSREIKAGQQRLSRAMGV